MSDEKVKFKVGEHVHIPMDKEYYIITKIYEIEGQTVCDLDDGDNFKLYAKSINEIMKIPKRGW